MKRPLLLIAAGVLALAATGCVNRTAQAQAKETAKLLADPVRVVQAQPVSTATLVETVEITGDVTAGEDTNVGAKQPGKVVSVFVKDGDNVTAGQLLAQLETETLSAQLQQAQSQVNQALAASNQARASLAQAIRNQSVGPTKTSSAVRQAQAQLRGAQANLKKAVAGARPEERRQAESNVAATRTALETQEKELQRVETLVREGALAANRLDQQRNAVAAARASFENATQTLGILRSGTRSEDISAAREQVRQAQEAVRTAEAQKELDPLLRDQVDGARAQLQSAQAQVQTAQAQVAIAQRALADAQIRAPFSGKVVGRPIQPGTIAGAGTTIVRIVGGSGVYFNGELPSNQITRVRSGLPVTVTISALGNRTFQGSVAAVSAVAASVARQFDVRVQMNSGLNEIRPGMFARGLVQVRTIPNATVVPTGAIVQEGDDAFVFIVQNEKAERLPVQTGIANGNVIQVSGVPLGATVVTQGQGSLIPGTPVRVETKGAQAQTKGAKRQG
jgi:RND family efflux transporter MFP subunit